MPRKTSQEDLSQRAQKILDARKQAEAFWEELHMEQNLPPAILGGGIAALLSAGLWGAITIGLNAQFGILALGIGLIVGFAVRFLGKGIDPVFGYVGAVWSLIGCLLGNVFAIVGMVAKAEGVSFGIVLTTIEYANLKALMVEWFSPIDILFYGICLYAGYRFSFRQIDRRELYRRSA